MTRARLRASVFAVMGALALLLAAALLGKYYWRSDDAYAVVKDFSPLMIAVAAAYLAYCFQRRQAFLVSLRDLWREMIETKGELIEYTHNPAPDRAAFGKAHRALSETIDSVRGVYRNVGETETRLGLYPLEPLHDMRKALDGLGFEDVTLEKQRAPREQIIQAWNAVRFVFLREFATPEPPHPITTVGATDPRRSAGSTPIR